MSANIEVTQRIMFSCAYLMKRSYYSQLNAHDYKFEATVVRKSGISSYSNPKMIISFENLQSAMADVSFEGCFLFNSANRDEARLAKTFRSCNISTIDLKEDVSAEVILNAISLKLSDKMSENFKLYLKETKLREGNNSYVTWQNRSINQYSKWESDLRR